MNIEDEIVEQEAKKMAELIDWEVISSFLIDKGWIRVEVAWYTNNENAIDISDWADKNCSKFIKFQRTYLFENPADATMFTLRWVQ